MPRVEELLGRRRLWVVPMQRTAWSLPCLLCCAKGQDGHRVRDAGVGCQGGEVGCDSSAPSSQGCAGRPGQGSFADLTMPITNEAAFFCSIHFLDPLGMWSSVATSWGPLLRDKRREQNPNLVTEPTHWPAGKMGEPGAPPAPTATSSSHLGPPKTPALPRDMPFALHPGVGRDPRRGVPPARSGHAWGGRRRSPL